MAICTIRGLNEAFPRKDEDMHFGTCRVPAPVRAQNPWYGYKRIAVMCRRAGEAVTNRAAYVVMRDHRLLHKPREPFLVTDNGPSLIAQRFGDFVRDLYSHVRIQYRTPQQLGLLERLHQTLKVEEVYWRLYENPQHARACLTEFRVRYNTMRPHWALVPEEGGDPLVPAEVYAGGQMIQIPRWQDWARAARARLETLLEDVV